MFQNRKIFKTPIDSATNVVQQNDDSLAQNVHHVL